MNALPEATQKTVEELVALYPKRWTRGVCAFEVVNKETGKKDNARQAGGGDVCHAGLLRMKTPAVVVNAHKPTWAKVNRDLLLWIAKESPFSHGVINRDNEDQLCNHASVMDSEAIGKGGVLWLCKAFRHFTEDTFKLEFWTKLRECGLDGFQAFVGADILVATGEPSMSNTHTSLFSYSSPAEIRKFYDEIKGLKVIEDTQVNRGGYGVYGYEPGGKKASNWGSLAGKTIKKKDGWGGFVEVKQPCAAKDYAAQLKEIFEGDPKNVK